MKLNGSKARYSNSTRGRLHQKIHGIPENLYSSTQDAVIKVAEALNITVVPSDAEIYHRLKHDKFWSNSLATRPSPSRLQGAQECEESSRM